MRRIYLVRHGLPYFPGGDRYCIGSADFKLDRLGHMQGCILAESLKDKKLTVFTSPLRRAYDTAARISTRPIVIDEFREMDAGDWDGLSFSEIQRRWPELYEARGHNSELPIPGSEDWQEGQRRFIRGVDKALKACEGDIVIVSHTTVILSFVCHILGSDRYKAMAYRPDYGCYYMAELDEGGSFSCRMPWIRPELELDAGICRRLMAAAETPEHVIAHCEAVAEEAASIGDELIKAGLRLSREKLCHAALLHDIARLHPDHAGLGGRWLRELGGGDIGSIIEKHHDFEGSELDEAAVLYIADKLIQGRDKLSLAERFEASLKKCVSPEALAAHERRYRKALELAGKINSLCGRELIK